jgi:hypothetical protein
VLSHLPNGDASLLAEWSAVLISTKMVLGRFLIAVPIVPNNCAAPISTPSLMIRTISRRTCKRARDLPPAPNGGSIFIDGFSGGQLPPKESIGGAHQSESLLNGV